MHKLIIIMGLPGSGKSTVAKIVASKLGFKVHDLDDSLSSDIKKKTSEGKLVTEKEREEAILKFRNELSSLLKKDNIIAPCLLVRDKHRLMLAEHFPHHLFIFLQVPFQLLKRRAEKRESHFFNSIILQNLYNLHEPITVQCHIVDATQELDVVVKNVERIITTKKFKYLRL